MLDLLKDKYPIILDKLYRWTTQTFAGILAKKIILASVFVFVTAINAPWLVVFIYSLHNGIPVFDAYDALKDKIVTFTTMSLIITFCIAIFAVVPGITWFFTDPALKGLPWNDKTKTDAMHRWTVRRWCSAFLPGVVTVIVSLLAISYFENGKDYVLTLASVAGVILGTFLYSPVIISSYISDRRKGILVRNSTHKTWMPNPPTNFVAFIYSIIYTLILSKAFENLPISENSLHIKQKFGEFWFYLSSYASLTLGCIMLLFLGSVWAGRRNYLLFILFIVTYLFFFIAVWPGASTLLQNYMRDVRLGGDVPVVITVNKNIAASWPEIFEAASQDGEFSRSKHIGLVLLGKDKVFVRNFKSDKHGEAVGTIMMDRSVVHEIMFLDSLN